MTEEARDYTNHYSDCYIYVPQIDDVRRVVAVGNSKAKPWDQLEKVPTGEDDLHFIVRQDHGYAAYPISSVVKDIPDVLGLFSCPQYGPLFVSRDSQRQWRKGVHTRTLNVLCSRGPARWGATWGRPMNVDYAIACALFRPEYVSVEACLSGTDGVISSNFYTDTLSGDSRLLFFRKWPVGFVRGGAFHLDKQVAHLRSLLNKDTNNSVEVRLV